MNDPIEVNLESADWKALVRLLDRVTGGCTTWAKDDCQLAADLTKLILAQTEPVELAEYEP